MLKADPAQTQRLLAAQKALEELGAKALGHGHRFLTPRMAYSCLLLFASANNELNRNGKKWKYSVSVLILLAQITPHEVAPMRLPLLQNPWNNERAITVYEGFSLALRSGSRWFSLYELVLAWMTLCKYKGNETGIGLLHKELGLLIGEFQEAIGGLTTSKVSIF